MIDCVFLLLFFFMVTSKIDRQSPVEMPVVINAEDVAPSKTVVVTAKLDAGGDAIMYLGDGVNMDRALSGELKDQEDQIRQFIETEVATRPEVTGIMLKADGKVLQKYVAMFSRAAVAGGGGRRLYFGVEEE
jgi:biopolymer transport protein ExbD